MANDFRESGLPGWDESDPNEVGCILLSEYTEDNLVVENLLPERTLASDQILDLTDDPTTEDDEANIDID